MGFQDEIQQHMVQSHNPSPPLVDTHNPIILGASIANFWKFYCIINIYMILQFSHGLLAHG